MSGAIVLTGASGFVGRALAAQLLARGMRVCGMARDPQRASRDADPRIVWMRGDLQGDIDPGLWSGASVLVHAAWATDPADPARAARHNVAGARQLFQSAATCGVQRIVFVSSMSAHPRALSHYGRSKLAVEELLRPDRDLAVRPGFVLGHGGVHQRLTESIRKLPFVPSFYGGRQPIQTIWVEDLARGIANAVQQNLTGRLTLACPEVVAIDQFYRDIAASIGKPNQRLVGLPGGLACGALQFCEKLGLRLPMTSENLLGLKALESADVAADLAKVQLAPVGHLDVLAALYGQRQRHD